MKKKGLIISTVVMAVVLIASLTTATYAWFSSTASVTVDNLNIKAVATEGLQIALKTAEDTTYTTGYTYGAVQYDALNDKWTSTEELDGFGTNLDFASVEVGQISKAVTNAATSTSIPEGARFVYTAVDPAPSTVTADNYTISADGVPTQCVAGAAEGGTTYYTRAAVVNGKFYVPTGYDDNIQPLGFFEVKPNGPGTYYDLPIRIKATTDIAAICCTITINSTAEGKFAPGMAAATRTLIGFGVNNAAENVYSGFIPYSSASSTVGGMTGVNDAEATLNFVVAYASETGAVVSATDVYTVHAIIWVEGTDPECNNYTTSATDFDVDFNFTYTKDATNIASDKVTISSVDYAILSGYSVATVKQTV